MLKRKAALFGRFSLQDEFIPLQQRAEALHKT